MISKAKRFFAELMLFVILSSVLCGCGRIGSFLSEHIKYDENTEVKIIAREDKGLLIEKSGQKILMVKGSPYEMGYQHGYLLKKEVKSIVKTIIEGCAALKPGMLEIIWGSVEEYIPDRYKDELKGLADGAGLSFEEVQLANIMPELFHCSGFAVFGNATKDGELLHGRILDYETNAGLQKHSVVIMAQPEGYNSYINPIVAGIIGSVTGMNDKQVTIGEMGGTEKCRDGLPMIFLLRMILEEANTLEEAMSIMESSKRTCEYYYVISDGKIPDARAMKCLPDSMEVLKPGKSHPLLPAAPPEDVVMISGEDRYIILKQRIEENFGNINRMC